MKIMEYCESDRKAQTQTHTITLFVCLERNSLRSSVQVQGYTHIHVKIIFIAFGPVPLYLLLLSFYITDGFVCFACVYIDGTSMQLSGLYFVLPVDCSSLLPF